MISLQKRKPGLNKDQRLLSLHDFTPPIILYVQLRVYKPLLKIKLWALFTEAWSPHVVLSLTFWLNFHLGRGGLSSLLILPGLLRSDQGGLSVSSPLGEWEDACSLRR